MYSYENCNNCLYAGTVLAALDNGMIQIWSHHPTGGFITEYKATHSPTDYVVSMCTDEKNQYLFTGQLFLFQVIISKMRDY